MSNLSQLLAGAKPNKFSFEGVEAEPIRRHPGPQSLHGYAHSPGIRGSIRGATMLVGLNIICIQLGEQSMRGKERGKVRSLNYEKKRVQHRALLETKGAGTQEDLEDP